MPAPSPDEKFPLKGYDKLCFLKNVVKNPNIIVGDYTYYDDLGGIENFENNVKYLFDFIGDKLIIGKYCSIATGVTFIMNGGNHLTESVSSFPFAIFGEDKKIIELLELQWWNWSSDHPISAYPITLGKARYSNSALLDIVSDHRGASIPKILDLLKPSI